MRTRVYYNLYTRVPDSDSYQCERGLTQSFHLSVSDSSLELGQFPQQQVDGCSVVVDALLRTGSFIGRR